MAMAEQYHDVLSQVKSVAVRAVDWLAFLDISNLLLTLDASRSRHSHVRRCANPPAYWELSEKGAAVGKLGRLITAPRRLLHQRLHSVVQKWPGPFTASLGNPMAAGDFLPLRISSRFICPQKSPRNLNSLSTQTLADGGTIHFRVHRGGRWHQPPKVAQQSTPTAASAHRHLATPSPTN